MHQLWKNGNRMTAWFTEFCIFLIINTHGKCLALVSELCGLCDQCNNSPSLLRLLALHVWPFDIKSRTCFHILQISDFGLLGGCLRCVLIKRFTFVCPADQILTQLLLPLWSGTMLVKKSLAKLVRHIAPDFFSSSFSFRVSVPQDSDDSSCSSQFCQLISLRFPTQANITLKGASNEYLAGEKASSLTPSVS